MLASGELLEHVSSRRIRALTTLKAVFEGKNLVIIPLALLATKGKHVASAPPSLILTDSLVYANATLVT